LRPAGAFSNVRVMLPLKSRCGRPPAPTLRGAKAEGTYPGMDALAREQVWTAGRPMYQGARDLHPDAEAHAEIT
jgi:hypothetical protein